MSVTWELEYVMGVVKKDTRLKIAQRGIEYKELEYQHQPQSSSLQLKGEIINYDKVELLPLYQEIPQLQIQLCKVYSPFVVNLHTFLWIQILCIHLYHILSSII